MFDNSIKFKYTWRSYQEKLLNEADKYLKDKKVNIVASPGSGKTVLGLELIRRLNNPVLILSPNLTIKNQWVDRFVLSFMPDGSKKPDWISTDVYKINKFNSITYQALHYAYKKIMKESNDDLETDDNVEEEKPIVDSKTIKNYDLVSKLKKNNIKTIILDEAHHLKKEWWNSIIKVINSIDDVVIISLTATPPYDVEYSEWKKYITLCGDIDAEISVPELVKDKNLCPHQDYIYFSKPTSYEIGKIKEYEKNVKEFMEKLINNQEFVQLILNHNYIKRTNDFIEDILTEPDVYSSMLIFLNEANINIKTEKVQILGHKSKIPELTSEWLEILLQYIIFDKRKEFNNEILLNIIETNLKQLGAIEKRKVLIKDNSNLKKYFVSSISKLNSINEIVDIEYGNLNKDLRMVILTDYLRMEYLNNTDLTINKMGVFPIFLKLLDKKIDMAILTGSVFMIPKKKLNKLYEFALEYKLNKDKIDTIDTINDYCIVKTNNRLKNDLMKTITKLFSIGEINIIIGTKSLLGEGWDEPSINSLILASFVGSYVLSNQMRGRAIRINSDDKNKTANIWHLVCVTSITRKFIYNADYDMIKRRFNSFIGVGYSKDVIESGIDRLDVPKTSVEFSIDFYNNKIKKLSCQRQTMAEKWFELVNTFQGSAIPISNEVNTKKEHFIKTFSIVDFKKLLLYSLTSSFAYIMVNYLSEIENIDTHSLIALTIIAVLIAVISNIFLIAICVKTIIFSFPKRQLIALTKVIGHSLEDAYLIDTSFSRMRFDLIEDKEDARLDLLFTGLEPQEGTIFYNCLSEIFKRTDNQRYILVNNKKFIKTFYNVPSVFSTNKNLALIFLKNWHRYIGQAKLVYTKSIEGRKILLKARKNTFDYTNKNIFENKKKVINEWK